MNVMMVVLMIVLMVVLMIIAAAVAGCRGANPGAGPAAGPRGPMAAPEAAPGSTTVPPPTATPGAADPNVLAGRGQNVPTSPPADAAERGVANDALAAIPEFHATMQLPPGYAGTFDANAHLFEARSGQRRFFIEAADPDDETLKDLPALVSFVEGFAEDGLTVRLRARGPVRDGFFVTATTTDEQGVADHHFFMVKDIAGKRLLCRLGEGMDVQDIATVRTACESLRAARRLP